MNIQNASWTSAEKPSPSRQSAEGGSRILLDNGTTRVVLRSHGVSGVPLAVVFNHLNANDVDRAGFAEGMFWGDGMDVLAVKSRRNHWFQDLAPAALTKVVAPLGYTDVCTYGVSMGGYGAMYFAKAVKARRAILFSPQYSVDPAFTPWERRWSSEVVDASMRHGNVEGMLSPSCEYVLIFDPKDRGDTRHAAMIEAATAATGAPLRRIPLPGATHEAVSLVHDTGLLGELTLGLADRRGDLAAVLTKLHRLRRQSFVYAYSLGNRARSRSPKVRRAISLEAERRAKTLWHRRLLAELANSQGWEEPLDRLEAEVNAYRPGEDAVSDDMVEHVRAFLKEARPRMDELEPAAVLFRLGILERLYPRATVLVTALQPELIARAVAARGCLVTTVAWRESEQGLPPSELPPAAFNAGLSFLLAERMDDAALLTHLSALIRALRTGAVLAVHYAVGQGLDPEGLRRRTHSEFALLVEAAGGRLINAVDLAPWRVVHLVRTSRPALESPPPPAAGPNGKRHGFRFW